MTIQMLKALQEKADAHRKDDREELQDMMAYNSGVLLVYK
jgi:hypothetical protein